jgi:hypothetical protein
MNHADDNSLNKPSNTSSSTGSEEGEGSTPPVASLAHDHTFLVRRDCRSHVNVPRPFDGHQVHCTQCGAEIIVSARASSKASTQADSFEMRRVEASRTERDPRSQGIRTPHRAILDQLGELVTRYNAICLAHHRLLADYDRMRGDDLVTARAEISRLTVQLEQREKELSTAIHDSDQLMNELTNLRNQYHRLGEEHRSTQERLKAGNARSQQLLERLREIRASSEGTAELAENLMSDCLNTGNATLPVLQVLENAPVEAKEASRGFTGAERLYSDIAEELLKAGVYYGGATRPSCRVASGT